MRHLEGDGGDMEGRQHLHGFMAQQHCAAHFQCALNDLLRATNVGRSIVTQGRGQLREQLLVAVVGTDVGEDIYSALWRTQSRDVGRAEDLARLFADIVSQPAGQDGFICLGP